MRWVLRGVRRGRVVGGVDSNVDLHEAVWPDPRVDGIDAEPKLATPVRVVGVNCSVGYCKGDGCRNVREAVTPLSLHG